MRSLLVIMSVLFSFAAIASDETIFVCNDQNSHAVYSLNINSDKIILNPVIKDSSVLSASEAVLKYEEGESTESMQLYAGKNKEGKSIVTILLTNDFKNFSRSKILEVEVLYSKDTKKLDQKTVFLCSMI